MNFPRRSLSPQESRVVLALTEQGRRDASREEIIHLLGSTPKAADAVIEGLRRKGWLERATWGKYLFIPPDQGPDAIGNSNLLALASRVADRYYIGFGTAAAHYGLTTQHRNVILLVTPSKLRSRTIGEARVRIVNQTSKKFFGFEPVDVLGQTVMMSDREKTALDCIDHPALAGGVGDVAVIVANASRRFAWTTVVHYVDRFSSSPLAHRLGWLLDYVKTDVPPEVRAHLLDLAAHTRKTWFGPDPARARVPDAIGFNETWRLFVNVSPEALGSSVGLGQRKTIGKAR
ncbi:MAG: type IV toxin-antitoxin system AbiEi family antitoxin [Vicinamibacterales bacterium]